MEPKQDSSLLIEESNDSAIESKRTTISSIPPQVPLYVDWKKEALNGNFMPAAMLLERNQIHVDDVVDPATGNRLIHLSSYRGFLNVVRTLRERYNCTINLKNNYGHNALHLACSLYSYSYHLLYFLIQYDRGGVDEPDSNNFTALFHSTIARNNIFFLYLTSLGANLYNEDNLGNNLLYYALQANNKFVLKFILSHVDLDINNLQKKGHQQSLSLADLLLLTKENSCTKFICKYKTNLIKSDILTDILDIYSNKPYYNHKNHDLLSTVLYYRQNLHRQPIEFIKLFHKMKFTSYCINLYINFFLRDLTVNQKLFILILNTFLKIIPFIVFSSSSFLFSETLFLLCFLANIYIIISLLFKPKEPKVLPASSLGEDSSIINQIDNKFTKDLFNINSEEEMCESCLISKESTTNHCKTCNRCVDSFFFHSNLFNICISKYNFKNYFYFYVTNFLMSYILCSLIYNGSIINSGKLKNDYMASEFYVFFSSVGFGFLINWLLLINEMALSLQNFMVIAICLGYNTTYYIMFKANKVKNQKIKLKSNEPNFYLEVNHSKFLVFLKKMVHSIFKRY